MSMQGELVPFDCVGGNFEDGPMQNKEVRAETN